MEIRTLGEFEHSVLLATLRLGEEAYSTTIVLELERRTGREVSPAAVYIALRRLEDGGLIESDLREDEGRGGRRERRYVAVTTEGLKVLRAARGRLLRLWEGLEPLLAEEGHG
jgi:DNA-binding PadR family transcriptional regulator